MSRQTSALYRDFAFFRDGYHSNHMQHNPDCIPPVRNQGYLNSCCMEAAVDAIYARMCLERYHPLVMGSLTELIDFLHLAFPPGAPVTRHESASGELVHRTAGWPNSAECVFEYVKLYGLSFRGNYRTTQGVHRVFEQDRPKRVTWNEYAARVAECPIVGDVLSCPSLWGWGKQDAIYSGPTQDEINHVPAYDRHAVLVVGVGHGTSFFLAKNSWGEDWGYYGYIKLAPAAICYTTGVYPGNIRIDDA